jgi:hypothetical protein
MVHEYIKRFRNVLVRPLSEMDIESLRVWRNCSDNSLYLRKINEISSEQQLQWYEKYKNDEDEIIFAIDEIDSELCSRKSRRECSKLMVPPKLCAQ